MMFSSKASSLPTTVNTHLGPYEIQERPREPFRLERYPSLFKYSNIFAWCLWFFYIIYQLYFTYVLQNASPNFMWRVWLVLLAEFLLSMQEIVWGLSAVFVLICAKDAQPRPCYRLVGNSAPTVDVFIPCCREPNDVIIDTVAAAVAQDYPPQRFRVFLLDDGHDEKLREATERLSKKSAETNGPQVRYLSRKLEVGSRSYFKAGNLQFGTEESMGSGGSEYIASLDSDMIPEPDWLRGMIPHLVLDNKMALACPPQRYYNVPDGDPLGQQAEFDNWNTIFEPLNDRLDAAMCTGSGFVVRRSALTEIGGWPLVEVGEDFMCSSFLSNAGWKIAYIGEFLQFGLVVDSMKAYVKQRTRWADSGIEVHKQFGFYLPGSSIIAKLTLVQRGAGIFQALREYVPVTNILALIVLPIAIFPTQSDEFATILSRNDQSWLRTIFIVAFISSKANNIFVYAHIGMQRLANFQSCDIWCAPYTAIRCIVSLFPTAPDTLIFESSGSIVSAANERSRLHRTPLPGRIFTPDLALYFTYIVYASIPLLFRLYATPKFPFLGALFKLLGAVCKTCVPLLYMLFPPTVPDRDDLLYVDEQGVRRPKRDRKSYEANDWWLSWTDACEFLVLFFWL